MPTCDFSSGIEYTIGRVPIASADFSTRKYSYDDVANDFDLEHFALADEDLKYKVSSYIFVRFLGLIFEHSYILDPVYQVRTILQQPAGPLVW